MSIVIKQLVELHLNDSPPLESIQCSAVPSAVHLVTNINKSQHETDDSDTDRSELASRAELLVLTSSIY